MKITKIIINETKEYDNIEKKISDLGYYNMIGETGNIVIRLPNQEPFKAEYLTHDHPDGKECLIATRQVKDENIYSLYEIIQ
jgi:hypothetical protein